MPFLTLVAAMSDPRIEELLTQIAADVSGIKAFVEAKIAESDAMINCKIATAVARINAGIRFAVSEAKIEAASKGEPPSQT